MLVRGVVGCLLILFAFLSSDLKPVGGLYTVSVEDNALLLGLIVCDGLTVTKPYLRQSGPPGSYLSLTCLGVLYFLLSVSWLEAREESISPASSLT